MIENALLVAGLGAYILATLIAVMAELRGRVIWRGLAPVLLLALLVHGAAIVLRWQRLDHGPYVNLFEILSSNVWSLHAALLAVVWALPRLRPILAATLPVLQVLVLWLLTVDAVDAPMPVTYQTVWLPVHVWVGKIFLGIVVVALGAAIVVLLRRLTGRALFPRLPASSALEEVGFRLVLLAFVFECMMLVAGAAWAQDAWGRYWAWDPLETWAFITWLAVALFLHIRVTFRPRPEISALAVVIIFLIAFATFFGMPFISTAPHKGMI
ncbi:MAG: cytochrome c biogenesis protein CcsA [Rhodospirillaceae bacterium]|nr:cytochrome c biogenesis protein CcsA [Rhodospirillales bacterium]